MGIDLMFALISFFSVEPAQAQIAPTQAVTQDSVARHAVEQNTLYYLRFTSQPNPLDSPDQLLNKAEFIKVELSPVGVRRTSEAQIFGLSSASDVKVVESKPWMDVLQETSTLRVSDTQPMFFISCERSVMLRLRFGKFQVKKNLRTAQLDKDDQLNFFKKRIGHQYFTLGQNRWAVQPLKPLGPGEYCVAPGHTGPVADFTILERK